ncbi:MAG TPA: tetratricopeptide repeat protein, partial [Polyangiaceae bacterium]|nr:tetratricopeptide repeat protein [Polyangiaceae bacterium]
DKAAEIAPDDPKVARAKIDALRITGDLPGARMLVARASTISSQPETVYVLAALDLAEDAPSWAAAIDRLKTSLAGEPNMQRARGALVYALVRSGDARLAKSELDKLASGARPSPILSELKVFATRAGGLAAEVDAGKREAGVMHAADLRGAEAPRLAEPSKGDYRALLQQASQSLSRRQYDKADQLYRAALASSPGDTEALSGLGDVARARGNTAAARSHYEQVLARNPAYLPALGALADIQWDSGDRAGAVKRYRQITEIQSDGALAHRAQGRIAQSEAAPAVKAAKPEKPPEPEPLAPEPAAPQPDLPPEIDTSDLPGFKR